MARGQGTKLAASSSHRFGRHFLRQTRSLWFPSSLRPRGILYSGSNVEALEGRRLLSGAPPTNLTAVAASAQEIDLAWQNNDADATSIEIDRSVDGTTFTQLTTLDPSTASYADTGLNDASHYWYRVEAVDPAGNSDPAAVSQWTAVPAPSELTTGLASADEMTLSWVNNSANASGIEVDRSTDGSTFSPVATLVGSGLAEYTDDGLAEGAHYWYQVEATSPGGASDPSNAADGWTTPLAPSGLAAIQTSSTEIDLSWTNRSTVASGIEVDRSLDGTTFSPLTTLSAASTSYDDTSVSASHHYWYRVVANSLNSNSAPACADAGTLRGPITTTTLTAEGDAYTRSGIYAGTNFGTATELEVNASDPGKTRQTYLTFDASRILGNIQDVQLRLHGGLASSSGTPVIADIVPITDGWGESTITWNNRPLDAGGAIASSTIATDQSQWYEWDLTSYIQNQLANGVTSVSIGVEGDAYSAGPYATFGSKESQYAPQLVVTTDVATFAPTSDAYVRDGAYADTTFGSSTELDVQTSATAGQNRSIFLTFDTSEDLNAISTAVVGLYGGVAGSTDTNVQVTAYPVASNTWSQNAITWNNAPTIDTSHPLSTATITGATPALYTWDITAYLAQRRALGLPKVSIALVSTSSTTNDLSFMSAGAPSNTPLLWTTASPMGAEWKATEAAVTLTWQPILGAASYSIYRSSTAGTLGTVVATGVTGTSYTDTTVPTGQTSYYSALPFNAARGVLQFPPDDFGGTVTGGGYSPGGGGPQLPILPPPNNHEIILGSAFGQPNFVQAYSSDGSAVDDSNTVPGMVGVSQFNPHWGTLIDTFTDFTYNYNWEWDAEGALYGSGDAGMYYASVPTTDNPDPGWSQVAFVGGGPGPWGAPTSGTLQGGGDGDAPALQAQGAGYGMENIQVISQLHAGCCGVNGGPVSLTVSGMWTGFYSVTYDYIPPA